MKPYSILVLITVFTLSHCIPTSILANTKDPTGQKNFKVKRSSSSSSLSSNEKPQSAVQQENSEQLNSLPSILSDDNTSNNYKSFESSNQNTENEKLQLKSDNELPKNIPDPIIAGLFMNSQKMKPMPHKRGISSQYLHGNNNNNNEIDLSSLTRNYPNYVPNGVWDNELDPMTSVDFQDFDDYSRAQYGITHNKPYDNLQNYLNSEPESQSSSSSSSSQYQGPIALPYQYSPSYGYNRYFNERNKRSNKQHSNFQDDPVTDYTELELTPNEFLALLAMIAAGALEKQPQSEIPMWESNNEKNYPPTMSKSNYYDDHEEIGSFLVPNKLDENDFDSRYQIPINFDNVPRYDIYNDNKANRGSQSKRFMVSKKKRSLGHFTGKPGISFSPMKGAKSIQKVI